MNIKPAVKRVMPGLDYITDIVKEYCVKFPTVGNRTLARMIIQDNPKMNCNLDNIRCRVRTRRGVHGNRMRLHARNQIEHIVNLFGLPESFEEKWEPYQLTINGSGVVLSDLHIPYHSHSAVQTTLNHMLEYDLTDFIILNGDVLDFYGLSFFSHDPTKPHFQAERESWFRFADILRDTFGDKCRIYYKAGNHDNRFERYMIDHAAELFALNDFRLENVLRLKSEFNITYIAENVPIEIGALNVVHGHEFGGGSSVSVNMARTAYLKTNECTLVGHGHRTSEHSETTIRGNLISCWSSACLCELHPRYRPINKWNHGLVELQIKGEDFNVRNRRILNGRVL